MEVVLLFLSLVETSSGHYAVAISPKGMTHVSEEICLLSLKFYTNWDYARVADKLPSSVWTCTLSRLISLVKSSNDDIPKALIVAIEKACGSCKICPDYKKKPRCPVVSLPFTKDFNELVAIDLHELEHTKLWYVHIIDLFAKISLLKAYFEAMISAMRCFPHVEHGRKTK